MKRKINDLVFIWQFALDDFKGKYAGSALGITWAFLQPIITIVLYWFVFQLGFKSQPVENFPFILWLLPGLVPWFFLSDAICNATSSLVEYSYLVKKVLFHINILPITKIVSMLMVQGVLIIFTIILYTLWGYPLGSSLFYLIVYIIYMTILAAGVSYLTATLYVFFKDTMQIVSIILQVFFWLTPIVWEFNMMSEGVRKILMLNPVYYIVQGYRDVFVYRNLTIDSIGMTVYYWTAAILILGFGVSLFNRCKDHFADVL